MSIKIAGLLIFFTLNSCGQNNEKRNSTERKQNNTMIPIPKESKHVSAANFVKELINKVEHYEREPMYFIRPLQSNCIFEILVNDYPIYKEYSLEKLSTPLEINRAILKSGIQTVTVRLYPLGDLIKKSYGKGETVETLLKKTQMQVSVVKYEAYNKAKSLDDEILIKKHKSPTKEGSEDFVGAGQDYYEYSFTFKAEVPYENKGWSDGQKLIDFDKDELRKQCIHYYNTLSEQFNIQDKDKIARIHFGLQTRKVISEFKNRKDTEAIWEEYENTLEISNKDFFDPEKGFLKFYGNGRIVALRHPTKTELLEDSRLRGKSAFGFKYKAGETSIRAQWFDVFLYLPEGQPLDSLQMIK